MSLTYRRDGDKWLDFALVFSSIKSRGKKKTFKYGEIVNGLLNSTYAKQEKQVQTCKKLDVDNYFTWNLNWLSLSGVEKHYSSSIISH